MIPLSYFLLAWLGLLLLFMTVAGLSIFQMLRYGLAHPLTELTTAAFILIIVVVVLGTLGYLSGLDLGAGLDIQGIIKAAPSVI